MEEVSGKQDHVDIFVFRQAHNLMEALPAIITTNVISLVVADMTIRSDEDADGVGCYKLLGHS